MIEVILYTRKGCHLCDVVYDDLQTLQIEYPHQLSIIDIDLSPELKKRFDEIIPVVEIGSQQLRAPINKTDLRKAFDTEMSIQQKPPTIPDQTQKRRVKSDPVWNRADDLAYWLTKHYLAVFNIIILFYVGLPFIAPILMRAGAQTPARLIYRGYGMMCHQLAYRSVFLFGEQNVYPREAANTNDLISYGTVTGLSEGDGAVDRMDARNYIGDERVGYKVALCQRDIAIYGGILLFGLIFGITGKRIPGLPWYIWILFGILPIAVDGLSQLISQPPLSFISYRESTWIYRILTGFLFGFTTAWFGYPLVEDSMKGTREVMRMKKKRFEAKNP